MSANAEQGSHRVTDEELFQFLKSFKIPLRLNDIRAPTTEFLCRVFNYFLADVFENTGITTQDDFATLNQLDCPDICESALIFVRLASHLNVLIGSTDLEIYVQDIICPKPKKTKRILYAVVAFWNLFISKWSILQSVEEKFETHLNELEELGKKCQELQVEEQQKCERARTFSHTEQEYVDLIQSDEEKVMMYEQQKEILDKEYQVVKNEGDEFLNKINAMNIEVSELKSKQSDLNEHIFTSPEKLDSKMVKAREDLSIEDSKLKTKLAELNQLKQDTQQKKASFEDVCNPQAEFSVAVEDFSQKISSYATTIIRHREEEWEVKHLEEQLRIQEESLDMQEQTSAKIFITTRKRTEAISEQVASEQKYISEKQKVLESLRLKSKALEKDLHDHSQAVIKMRKEFKLLSVDFEKNYQLHHAKMQEIVSLFKGASAEQKQYLQKKFLS